MDKKTIEIPLGAKDSELCKFEYTIPEGYEAEIKDGKVIMKKESEDEKIRNYIQNELACLRAPEGKGSDRYNELTSAIAYLERQKDKVVKFDHDREQKLAEWSEENEKAITEIVCILSVAPMNAERSKELHDWIQHLRPQPHWKPSKQQMKALNAVANEGVLLDLFNDLLKLF